MTLARLLLACSSLTLAAGALLHAAAFGKALEVIAKSNLPPFFAASFRMLWIGDSATLILVAAIFAWVAVQPSVAKRPIVFLAALIPASTAALMYAFIGPFFAIPLLLAPSVAAGLAVLLPGASETRA